MCFAHRREFHGIRLYYFQIDFHRIENRRNLLKCHYKIHSFITLCFFTLGHTRSHKYYFCIGMFFLGNTCGIVHWRTGSRNIFFHVGNILVHQLNIRRTAGSSHKLLAFLQFFNQLMCFIFHCFHCTLCDFNHIGETDLLECSVYLFDSSTELS